MFRCCRFGLQLDDVNLGGSGNFLFRWCIAGGSGDYGGILGDWDLVLVSSLGISLLSGCGMNSLCLTCHHDVLWHQRPSVGGAKDGRLTSLRQTPSFMGRASHHHVRHLNNTALPTGTSLTILSELLIITQDIAVMWKSSLTVS